MKFSILILITLFSKNFVISSNIEYSECLETRVYCQSLPEDCVQKNSECDILLIASPSIVNNVETGVQFQLFGKIDEKRHWFAMGLSEDGQMGNDSVTEIYVSKDGKLQALRQSWNEGKHNQVINGGVDGITQVGGVVNSDGILSGKWIRNGVTEVHSNRFNIMNNKYYILLATGPIDANNNKKYHSERSVSKTKVDLQFSNDQALEDLYANCKESETICFGFPDKCINSKNCRLVLAVTKSGYGMSSGTVGFHLMGKPDDKDSGWIAAALSEDNQMGSDSVVECLLLSNSTTLFRNSWNEGTTNQVIGDVNGIIRTGPVLYQDGWLNCKWTRAQNTKVKNMNFNLMTTKYYILLAKGPITDQTSAIKRFHSEKISSETSVDLESQQISTTTSQPTSSTPIPSALSDAYNRCHKNTRLCFGTNPKNSKCVETNDCTVLFSSVPKSEGIVEIELFWDRGSSDEHWAAVGLSTDQKMGEDSVTECILKSDGKVVLREGWNLDGHKGTINVNDNSTISLDNSFLNGVVYCKWQRNAFSSVQGHDFNIKNDTFYLLLAHGRLTPNDTNLQSHSDAQSSSKKVSLQTVGILTTASPISVQLHATFMIVGWLGCVAIAILLARHYKNSWPDSTLCGVKIWFAFHRFLMVCGVTLVLAATIIIFVNKEGWVGATAHPIVGLTSIILCFLQPIGALFRPNPDSSNRWIFNWLHWSGGYIGYLLSFVAICLSTNFSNLVPKQSLWILIAYIIVYILSHVLHHLKTILREKQKANDIQSDKSGRETLIDLTLALLSAVIIVAFVLALVILLFI